MKKALIVLNLLIGLLISAGSCSQPDAPNEKMSVNDRLTKARAVKAEKRTIKSSGPDTDATGPEITGKGEKATPADYQTPVVKSKKGPNGEVVHTGERGGQYYINKRGNKTYFSSNQ